MLVSIFSIVKEGGRMDLENLKTFVTLANLGNFTQTAQQHMIVQSTVSSRIRELEREIGTPLFIRERKNVRLTLN